MSEPPRKPISYHRSLKLATAQGPFQNLAREDFILIGIGLRLYDLLEKLDGLIPEGIKLSNPGTLHHDIETLRRKAEKFEQRYSISPKDFHGLLPSLKRSH